MFRRAKISALFTLAGVLTAVAAPLNPELKNAAFQPDATAPIVTKATVIKPAASNNVWKRFKLWRGAKVQPITPAPQPAVKVEVNRFAFTKAPEAAAPQADVKTAGSGH